VIPQKKENKMREIKVDYKGQTVVVTTERLIKLVPVYGSSIEMLDLLSGEYAGTAVMDAVASFRPQRAFAYLIKWCNFTGPINFGRPLNSKSRVIRKKREMKMTMNAKQFVKSISHPIVAWKCEGESTWDGMAFQPVFCNPGAPLAPFSLNELTQFEGHVEDGVFISDIVFGEQPLDDRFEPIIQIKITNDPNEFSRQRDEILTHGQSPLRG
jgi:hypothetical protein